VQAANEPFLLGAAAPRRPGVRALWPLERQDAVMGRPLTSS